MSKLVMPAVFVVLVGLAAYAATLPGFSDAVAFLFTPDVSVLADPLVWSAAFGQVFFSLSVGQGIMLTYGSYLDEGTDVTRSALYITVADIVVALLAGLVIFPVVFSVGLAPTLGTELAFSTLPRAFEAMPLGSLVAVASFGLLFFAALSSAVSLLEVGVAAAVRATGRSRRGVAVALTVGVFCLGLPSALSYSAVDLRLFGAPVLDVLDESVGTLALPVTATLIAVVFTWFDPRTRLQESVPSPLFALVEYVIPVVLVGVTALRLVTGVSILGRGLRPGVALLGGPLRAVGTLALLAAALVVGRLLAGRVRARRPD